MEDLISSGEASGVEEFRRRGKVYHVREDLKEKRRDALYRLQRFSGPGEYLESPPEDACGILTSRPSKTRRASLRNSNKQCETVH